MNFIFILVYSFWLLSEIFLSRFRRSKKNDLKNADRGSLRLIWILIFIANFLGVYISKEYDLPISDNPFIQYIGLLLVLIGVALRLKIVLSLGKYFTVDVTIKDGHQLKKDGFYKYLRHPSYSASILSFIGFGISLNNWLSLLIISVLIFTAFVYRISVEEKVLIEHFGEDYLNYKRETKGLIPFTY